MSHAQPSLFPNISKQEIILGDCLDVMKTFPDNHFTSIVTDPPYGLGFMGKKWDKETPCEQYWIEALRICKPGAMMLCFGGTRTYHRLACAIEDAGWDIRDCLMWIYGSGFPKSHNHFGLEGYGTALKPAYEPIIMAMKPLEGTFAQNAEKHGVAGINIDGCRIDSSENLTRNCLGHAGAANEGYKRPYHENAEKKIYGSTNGRWPANIIFDEEAAKMLDEQSGNLVPAGNARESNITSGNSIFNIGDNGKRNPKILGDKGGGASRFFYCAKASSSERGEGNIHPTVKPLKLMEYLLKLISPPTNALILDPFAGSGTTIIAAKNLDINAIGVEKQKEYCEIANMRVDNA